LAGLGTVQAFNSVLVKSRVDGQIVKINFSEGKHVHAGEVLVEIDPAPFEATLGQAQANKLKGTSNNCRPSSGAPNLSGNDSALFPVRFYAVHPKEVRDCHLRLFFEVPFR